MPTSIFDATEGRQSHGSPIRWNEIGLTSEMTRKVEGVKQRKVDLGATVAVYEGFGSFHSANVEDLIAQSDEQYKPPECLPFYAKKILARDALRALSMGMPHLDEDRAWNDATCKRSRYERGDTGGAQVMERFNTTPKPAGEFTCSPNTEGAGAEDEDCDSPRDGSPSSKLATLVETPVEVCSMGTAFREKHFIITPHMTFINHGAFGSSLAGAIAIKRLYEDRMESEVVEFVDRELLPLTVHSIRCLSRFIGADPRQVVLLQNATFALNCATNMITQGDIVAYLDTEYLSVYKMIWFRCKEVGATHHEIALNQYLHDEAVMGDDAALTNTILSQLPAGCTTFIIDYVTSTSALCFPIFSHIVPALSARGVQKIIVDGAHSPLQLDLNFLALPPESQPTVFIGNLHKWFSSPKSVGFLWIRGEDSDNIRSAVLSHGAGDGLLSEFIWDGTRDYGAYFSVPAIVDFWETQGVDRVRAYCTGLLNSAVDMLTTAFHSRKTARRSPFMSLVELPEELQDNFISAKYIQDLLHDYYAIEVPVKRVENRYYVRISAFVYNTPQEYVYLREAVLAIADAWIHSEGLRKLALEASRLPSQGVSGTTADGQSLPCDERVRRIGGCGVPGLDPTLKRKRTKNF